MDYNTIPSNMSDVNQMKWWEDISLGTEILENIYTLPYFAG